MENDIRLEDMPPTYQQIARVIGLENVVKLGREFGGEQFYLHMQLTPPYTICRISRYGKLSAKYN